jgi:ectoine hydroxylase-related dioxygenase (phytanoyl-CoA dioxygenase family)
MAFTATHWDELTQQGYTIVHGAIDAAALRAAQEASDYLASIFPEGWQRSKNELWREIKDSRHPAFLAIAANVLDLLVLEILESVQTPDRIQFAQTLPGFTTGRIVGRHFHIDGGVGPALAAFNILFGVALTDVASNTAGGLHVLPGSHEKFAAFFREQQTDTRVHWGEIKQLGQKKFLTQTEMVVPRLQAGDILVAHGFLAHGTSFNTTDVRRDMIFQRRAAAPLGDPATQAAAREAFMRDPWTFFRRR